MKKKIGCVGAMAHVVHAWQKTRHSVKEMRLVGWMQLDLDPEWLEVWSPYDHEWLEVWSPYDHGLETDAMVSGGENGGRSFQRRWTETDGYHLLEFSLVLLIYRMRGE